MKIIIEIRSVYGENKAYPVCAAARHFADIAGTKTLTRRALRSILAMGVTIEARSGIFAVNFGAGDDAKLPAVA